MAPLDETRRGKIAEHVRAILSLVGEDPNREGLLDTPNRVAKMYEELFSGLDKSTEPKVTLFKNTEHYDEMICETNLEFFSHCEHHLVPFFGKVHIGYIPKKDGYYVGLSKLARIVDYFAHRPQVQERLTCQVADWIMKTLKPVGCIVVVEAEHMCMSMRGVKKPRHLTTTSALRGAMRGDAGVKAEFFSILRK
jgi:GTP cyclohydrolase I